MNVVNFKLYSFLVVAICSQTLTAAKIHWVTGQSHTALIQVIATEIEGLEKPVTIPQQRWKSWLKVYVEQESGDLMANLPPILGSYEITKSGITFTPQFPFSQHLAYRAELKLPASMSSKEKKISSIWIPEVRTLTPITEVTQIYPTSNDLPENLLKFYLTFSNPMSGGHVYDHIHLFNESMNEVELPFLELGEELWDDTMERLTLFIDPGRIKRGVKPLEEIGPSLQNGKKFRLVIDQDWKDASGRKLKRSFTKEFTVTKPDRQAIDTNNWEIIPPKSQSENDLIIKFGEPLDYALSRRLIVFHSPEGNWVEGTSRLGVNETELHFKPKSKWQKGKHSIRIQTILEDLAGNNVGKSFEVDVFDHVQRRIQSKFVERSFTID